MTSPEATGQEGRGANRYGTRQHIVTGWCPNPLGVGLTALTLCWNPRSPTDAYDQVAMDGFGLLPDGRRGITIADLPLIDHVYERGCRFRDCIEPSHLEAVTHAVNVRRAAARRYNWPEGRPA